jgi:hypothetical protein
MKANGAEAPNTLITGIVRTKEVNFLKQKQGSCVIGKDNEWSISFRMWHCLH